MAHQITSLMDTFENDNDPFKADYTFRAEINYDFSIN